MSLNKKYNYKNSNYKKLFNFNNKFILITYLLFKIFCNYDQRLVNICMLDSMIHVLISIKDIY